MLYEFSRTELLIGKNNMEKLARSKVAVFGIGGVGSFVVEGLVRAGVGNIVLIDSDYVCITNTNRQIHATTHTIGKPKVEVMKERILEINPKVTITTHQIFIDAKSCDSLIQYDYNYIVDAIDTITSKVDIIVKAKQNNIPIISSMGTGNKMDPTKFEISDIYKTSVCPLAKVIRKLLREKNVPSLKVLFSKEIPLKPMISCETTSNNRKRQIPGSISFVPSVAGLIIAGEVIKDLVK